MKPRMTRRTFLGARGWAYAKMLARNDRMKGGVLRSFTSPRFPEQLLRAPPGGHHFHSRYSWMPGSIAGLPTPPLAGCISGLMKGRRGPRGGG